MYFKKFSFGSIFFIIFLICKNTALTICPNATWSSNATTVAGSTDGVGGASMDLLLYPSNLYIDGTDNIYVVDNGNYRVQRWVPGSNVGTSVIQGSFGSDLNQFSFMCNMDIDIQGNIFVLDAGNARVTKWTSGASKGILVAGGNGMGNDTDQLNWPGGMFLDRNTFSSIWIADSYNHRIVKWTFPSTSVIVCGSQGSAADELNYPGGLFVDQSASNTLYIADTYNHRIQMWPPGATSGTTVAGQTEIPGNGVNQLNCPLTLLVDTNKIMFIADSVNVRIMKWIVGASFGEVITSYPAFGMAPSQSPVALGLAFDSTGSLFVVDNPFSRIQKFDISCPNITSTSTMNTMTTQSSIRIIQFLLIIHCGWIIHNNN